MFRSLLCKYGVTLKRTGTITNGESSSSPFAAAKYFSRVENQNVVVISNSRVPFIFRSFSTTSSTSDSSSSFVVSYLINSCGLSESEAITASKKINFKTTSNPDSVLALLKAQGFTQLHISKLIPKYPAILSSKPDKTLKPKFDFFKSKGLYGIELANIISKDPLILNRSFNKGIIPSFDILKTIVHSDQNVIKILKRSYWILCSNQVKRVMVNLELLRNQGVPQDKINYYLIQQPTTFAGDADRFKKTVEKVKEMGFNHLQLTFLIAVQIMLSMTEFNWRKKIDVYKRCGWSEDEIQAAFRRSPLCMSTSEKKIMAIMNFLVNEMNYDSSSVAEHPVVFQYSFKERIIPRCSVIRVLVSRGLIKENICLSTLVPLVDESFLDKFVKKYELQN